MILNLYPDLSVKNYRYEAKHHFSPMIICFICFIFVVSLHLILKNSNFRVNTRSAFPPDISHLVKAMQKSYEIMDHSFHIVCIQRNNKIRFFSRPTPIGRP